MLDDRPVSHGPRGDRVSASAEPRARFVAVVLVLLALFVALAVLVTLRPILGIDVQVEQALQAQRPAWLDALATALSFLGFPPWSTVIDGVIVLAIALTGQRWSALCAMFAAAGSAAVWFLVLEVVHRPRPTPDLVYVAAKIGYGSFPSGHALNTLAFYGFLAVLALDVRRLWLRRAIVVVCVCVVLGVGISRIYVGEHWPTDVLGGYVLGAVWLLISRRLYVTGTLPAPLRPWLSNTNRR